jgi:oligoendopeptidase F
MTTKDTFIKHINEGYATKAKYYTRLYLRRGDSRYPVKTLKRHGLIADSGTGKTKTIQVLCEQLSSFGPTLDDGYQR